MKISFLLTCIFLILLDCSIANENAEFFNLIDRIKAHPSIENLAFLADEKANLSVSEKSLPDPMLKFGIQNYPSNGQGGFDRYAMTQKTIGITQKIPNIKIRESSAREAIIDSEKISLQKELKTQQLISIFVVTVAEIKRIKEQQQLLEEKKEILNQTFLFWQSRVAAAEKGLDGLIYIEALLAELDTKLLNLNYEETKFTEQIRQLIGEVKVPTLPTIKPFLWPNDNKIIPLMIAEKDIDIASTKLDKAKASYGSDYEIGVKYGQRDSSSNYDGGDMVSIELGMTLPIWSSTNQDSKVLSAGGGLSAAIAQFEDLKRQWHQELATRYAKINEINAKIRVLEKKSIVISNQVDSLYNEYELTGRMDLVLDAKIDFIDIMAEISVLKSLAIKESIEFNSWFKDFDIQKNLLSYSYSHYTKDLA